ncbi:unnamed protein product [Polarella glacialis]|uniref:DOT1 domain-containing protein n=1 Tax=Polarella glacialis TaxID=89957 RepID=A0A813FEY0_POLGL|nr:unnamed protein product [Polarella glacialis]
MGDAGGAAELGHAEEALCLAAVERLFERAGLGEVSTHEQLAKQGAAEAVAGGALAASLVYGEILTPLHLFRTLRLGPGDVFCDLGSGRGQVVLAAAMLGDVPDDRSELSGPPRRSVGVELLRPRHDAAAAALEVAPQEVQDRCDFRCEDALAADLREATKVYVCNAAFPRHLNDAFSRALAPAKAPNLKAVATCAALPEESLPVACLELAEVASIAATWATEGAPLFLYKRCGLGSFSALGRSSRPMPASVRYEADRQLQSASSSRSAAESGRGMAPEDERSLLRSAGIAWALKASSSS